MAIHLDYRFAVDNQMMSFGYSDRSFKTWDCLLSLKAAGLEEFLARSEIDFVKFIQRLNKLTRVQGYPRPTENNKI